MVAYFFFGPATLDNLEPMLLATALVPLGDATVPRDGWAPEREGGLSSALAVAAFFAFFFAITAILKNNVFQNIWLFPVVISGARAAAADCIWCLRALRSQ